MLKTKKKYDCSTGCPIEATLDLIDGKWKGVVIHHLLAGTLRFNELHRRIPTATQRMLTRQLRELEESGLVARRAYAEVPPRVEYSLTTEGRTLEPLIRSMHEWGMSRMARIGLARPVGSGIAVRL